MVGLFKGFPHKSADGIKKIGMDNNIPVLAGVAFLPAEIVDVCLIEEYHISGVENPGFTVESMGNGAFQNIENLIELVCMDNFIAVLGNFGVERMFRCGHPVVKNNKIHSLHLLTSLFQGYYIPKGRIFARGKGRKGQCRASCGKNQYRIAM